MSQYQFNRNFAVIVGINNYKNGIAPLETAVPDAHKLAHIIQQQHRKLKDKYHTQNQYEVQLFLNERANLHNLNQLVEDFKKGQINFDKEKVKVTEDDRFLFYFAGHGIALDALENQEGPVGYLIPQDAKLEDSSTYLPMQDLHDALNALPCRHMLAILDCCFAGAFRWASLKRDVVPRLKVYKERYDRFICDRAWQVITSAADDQKALDSLGQRGKVQDGNEVHSPFALALFDALRGDTEESADLNKDGIITATELYSYLRDRVEVLTENHYKRQTPSLCPLRKHDKGEFIFLLPDFDRDKLEDAPRLIPENNPYRGLQSYDEKDSGLFFGRENLIKQLCQHVVSEQQALTVVLGASGTGKSSLMKAGLLPRLRHFQEHQFQILEPMRPGESPLQALAQVCSPIATAITAEELAKDELALTNIVEAWGKIYPKTQLLLPIDQFEELITLCKSDEEREQFQKLIKNAITRFSKHIDVVVTLRLDFEAQFQNSVLKDFWNDARFVVPPMNQDEFRQAIEKPASEKVVYFDPPSLVDDLINEVVQMPGALPLLSFTLSELYLKYIEDRQRNNRALTKKDYEELGRVVGSLTKRANHEYDQLVAEDSAYKDTVRRVMLRMISLQGGELARRQVLKSELEYPNIEETKRVNTVIKSFSNARLIVEGSNSQGEAYVEPAHDALVLGWDKLLAWKQGEEANIILQRQLTPAAFEWNKERAVGFLWDDNPHLEVLKKVLHSEDNWLNKVETEFVQRSIGRKQFNTRFRWGAGFTGIVVLLLALIGGRAAQINQIRAFSQSAEIDLQLNQQLEGLINSLQAAEKLKTSLLLKPFQPDAQLQNQVKLALQKAVYQAKERNRIVLSNPISYVVFSPNGQLLATVQQNGMVGLWERSGKQIPGFKQFNVGDIQTITFTPDNQQLITVSTNDNSTDQTVKLWNFNGQEVRQKVSGINEVMIGSSGRLLRFSQDENNVIRLRELENGNQFSEFATGGIYQQFSPDGRFIATAPAGDTIYIWDVNSRQKLAELKEHFMNSNIPVYMSFSPDSRLIATAGPKDDIIYLWDLRGNQLAKIKANQGGIQDISFSPDGNQLATVGNDGSVRIWQDISGKQLVEVKGYKEENSNMSLSSDGQTLVISDSQGTLHLLSLNQNKQLDKLATNIPKISDINFSPDNQLLAIIREEGTIHLLDLQGKRQLSSFEGPDTSFGATGTFISQAYGQRLPGLSFSKDGNWLAIGGDKITLRKRDGQEVATFKIPVPEGVLNNWVQTTAFAPNSSLLATGGEDGLVRLWNLNTLQETQPLIRANTLQVRSIAFSPKENVLATAGLDGSIGVVRLWNLSGEQLAEFKGFQGAVLMVIFSPDGNLLATAGSDGTVRLWNLSGQELAEFKGFDEVKSIAFSRNSQQLVVAGYADKLWQAKQWQIENLDELFVRGCQWVRDYLKNGSNLNQRKRELCDNVPEPVANGGEQSL